jgi:hypothetical protein
MTPFKEEGHHIVLELLYNIRHKEGHSIVENTFGILKKPFREFLTKFGLHVSFLPNVSLFVACYIIYYVFKLKQMSKG